VPFTVKVFESGRVTEGHGKIKVLPAEPSSLLAITAVMSDLASVDCPIPESLTADVEYSVRFDPPLPEFQVSQRKGKIKAGEKNFPFKVSYTPSTTRRTSALMIIDCRDREITVLVTGAVPGQDGGKWAKRARIKL
jgi:hypothetical protein